MKSYNELVTKQGKDYKALQAESEQKVRRLELINKSILTIIGFSLLLKFFLS